MESDKGNCHWGLEYINATRIPNRNAGGILVAVLDGGMDVSHTIFQGSIWRDPRNKSQKFGVNSDPEKSFEGIYGIDFTDPLNPRPNPVADRLVPHHATRVASIIGGRPVTDVFQGGVAHSVQIMSLKVQPTRLEDSVEAVIKAVRFAIDQGAHILNCSFVIYGKDEKLAAAFEEAQHRGVLVVAAAGNEDEDLRGYPGYPAAINLDYFITVGAIRSDLQDHLSHSSNYGPLVHLAAPGDGGIHLASEKEGTIHPGKTSFAAAYVSGAAALIWAQRVDPSKSRVGQAQEVRELMLSRARQVNPCISTGEIDLRTKTWGIKNPVLDLSFLSQS